MRRIFFSNRSFFLISRQLVYHSHWSFPAQKTIGLLHSATSSSRLSACSTCFAPYVYSFHSHFRVFGALAYLSISLHIYTFHGSRYSSISIDCISSSTCRVAPFSWSFLSFWLLHPLYVVVAIINRFRIELLMHIFQLAPSRVTVQQRSERRFGAVYSPE